MKATTRALVLALAVAAVVPAVGRTVQEEEAAATEGSTLTPEDVSPFLGYWMLSMDLNGNTVKMGLIVGGRGDVLRTTLVSPFGELDATNYRKEDEKFGFDLNGPFGQLTIDTWMDGHVLRGHFANDSGELAADFTGEHSDRIALQRFLAPDNETRIAKGDEMVRIRFAKPKTGEQAFQQLDTLAPGQVVQFVQFAVIKLTTDFNLEIGGLAVPKENIAPNYPGVYGLWLKRTDSGWALAVNEKADVWGTQYDPGADIGEVPLTVGTAEQPSETLVAKLQESEGTGTLSFVWGDRQWTTPIRLVTE